MHLSVLVIGTLAAVDTVRKIVRGRKSRKRFGDTKPAQPDSVGRNRKELKNRQ